MLRKIKLTLMPLAFNVYRVIYWIMTFLPIKDKVVATTMRGRKYSDNPRFLVERLHEERPDLEIVWFVDERWPYELPDWLRAVPYYKGGMLKRLYEMATAKVWINSHLWEYFIVKRKGQMFIETDHSSIPLKKVHLDLDKGMSKKSVTYKELIRTAENADVYLSDSDFHKDFFKRAYAFKGPVFKSGFPRNDELVKPSKDYRAIVREKLHLGNTNIFLYAPTFRDSFERTHKIDYSVYDVDYEGLHEALKERFGGEWTILVKYHPIMQIYLKGEELPRLPYVKDVTSYVNMQELISGADLLLTDYSSSIIDAAIAGVPGLTLCLDFDSYKKERDVYFQMDELPFPFARSNSELIENIKKFDRAEYDDKWKRFVKQIGLVENGNATAVITKKICDFIDGKDVTWRN